MKKRILTAIAAGLIGVVLFSCALVVVAGAFSVVAYGIMYLDYYITPWKYDAPPLWLLPTGFTLIFLGVSVIAMIIMSVGERIETGIYRRTT